MTDSEIVKALEYCSKQGLTSECEGCKMGNGECRDSLVKCAFDLINRLQAENERSKATVDSFTEIGKLYSEIKAEAYKECIEKVKAEINKHSYGVLHKTVINFKLDNLLKEMAGDNQ